MSARIELIHRDRREHRRYPIVMELRYKVNRHRSPLYGVGRTQNISSGGVLFGGDQNLPVGSVVELSLNWPIRLQETCPLTLLIIGRVVRSGHNNLAVKMNRYEFHTRPSGPFLEEFPGSTAKAGNG